MSKSKNTQKDQSEQVSEETTMTTESEEQTQDVAEAETAEQAVEEEAPTTDADQSEQVSEQDSEAEKLHEPESAKPDKKDQDIGRDSKDGPLVAVLPIDVAPLIVPILMRRAGITGPNTDKKRSVFDRNARECNVKEEANGDLKVSVRGTNEKEERARSRYHDLRVKVASAGQKERNARHHWETTKDQAVQQLADQRKAVADQALEELKALQSDVATLEGEYPVLLHDQLTSEIATLGERLPRLEKQVEAAERNLDAWETKRDKEAQDDKIDAAIEASKEEIKALKQEYKDTQNEIAAMEAKLPELGYEPTLPAVYVVPFGASVTFTP